MIHVGALDHPVARSSHAVPTPKGGGVGIAAAYTAGTLWLLYIRTLSSSALVPLCPALFLALVSYVDDVRARPFVLKLCTQIAAAVAVIAAGDNFAVIDLAGAPLHPPAVIGMPLTLAWVLFVTNAVNFIDGLNGLASGSVLVAGVALAAGSPAPAGEEGLPLVAGIAGFLPFNYPRARIFMGDVGSQLCGFVAADLAIRAASLRGAALIIPLALMPVLADVAFTLVRRWFAGDRLTEAHRSHLYQVAHRAGTAAPVVAAVYWVMAAWGAACGLLAGHFRGGLPASMVAFTASLMPMVAWFVWVAIESKRAGITKW
jgi:UDP-GlcNAc:undecaprenyl-phosphate GlcNAc-1-phosphate transferase